MAFLMSEAARLAITQRFIDFLEDGGSLKLWPFEQPENVSEPVEQIPLAVFELDDSNFAPLDTLVIGLTAPIQATVQLDGYAQWWTIYSNSQNGPVAMGTVGLPESGYDLELSNPTLEVGVVITLHALTLEAGNG